MNSTLFTMPVIFVNNSMMTTVELWFIPFDILQIICNVLVIGLATFFLFIIVLDKTCRKIPMILIANSCLAELIAGSDTFWMALFALHNDLKQTQYQDLFCIFRGYLSYVSCALLNYSYLLMAIYRYVTVVYPTRLFWRSMRTQIFLIGLKWIFAFGYCLPFVFTGDIIYNVDNQICQIPFRFSFPMVYGTFCCYIIPVSMIMFIYLKLVRYVHRMKQRVTTKSILNRAQKDLKMVRQIVILVTILLIICLPYALLVFMSFFTTPPKYHFRIAFICISISLVSVMIILFQFTDTLKTSVKKIINGRLNMVIPALA